METIRRRRDKFAEEQEQKRKEQEAEKLLRNEEPVNTSPHKIEKDDSLSQLLKQQKLDWEREKLEAEIDAKRERPTLHNISLPNLRPMGFGVWRALHEMGFPPSENAIEDLEDSGIPKHIQEKFKIGCIENLMEVCQTIARKFKPDELEAAGFRYLAEYAQKNVPVILFPYLRDEEICFITCRAFLSQEERRELGVPRYIRMGEKIPFPYNSNCFEEMLGRERKKVFFLYPSRYRLNILSKEEDVLIVAEKGFDAISIREFRMEEEWMKLIVSCEPVLIVDESDRSYPDWRKHADTLSEQFSKNEMVMREEILPEGIIVPNWFVKSNLGERTFKVDKQPEQPKPKHDHK